MAGVGGSAKAGFQCKFQEYLRHLLSYKKKVSVDVLRKRSPHYDVAPELCTDTVLIISVHILWTLNLFSTFGFKTTWSIMVTREVMFRASGDSV